MSRNPQQREDETVWEAIVKGDLDSVRQSFQSGFEVNAKDTFGKLDYAALHYAVINGHYDIVKMLIESGANVDVQDSDGNTPLIWAAYDGRLDSAKLLIQSGANLQAKNHYGNTALHGAAKYGYDTMASLLIESGATINARDRAGNTPLHDVLDKWKGKDVKAWLETIQALLQHGADPALENNNGQTALSIAIHNEKKYEVAIPLLQSAAKTNPGKIEC